MPSCILRVSGENFDVDAFIRDSILNPYQVHYCGEIRRESEIYSNSGMSIGVSNADDLI